ncbi:hypothetical protein [Rathayibacter iranicus]|uniref:Uncharacterized protein n=2 Tax=Rathayibacter iranicus TaxID=59737 RepID=A0AAD1AG42_9MICO|nr:hypothetical protein [Rathayibacter iranicus]AZZ55586.1 hypothetical protein C7V51_06565 [Rathayibacter iranicus]MWV31054.1 hypothetical protein [Rathayibacter iranicus NCPPB 2253 = VKM Ac-1602]PPI47983.1 hypothetical protein C5E09_05610 [Rathayibacter iranicus]PPI61007.1 hypothetical protein C5E08_06545 [Rathayibacter iranicus]PPI73017.1 hypothetical protein C5E01_04105 [Rathayibacter iranicus]
MIEWFTMLQVGIAVVAGLLCLLLGLLGRRPSDVSVGATAIVELLLIVQLAVAIVSPLVGNRPSGSLLEYYIYLISALLLPLAAGFWALIERSRWSTVILGVACLSIAVMVFRMHQIWFVQIA